METRICGWGLCGQPVQEINKRTGKSYVYCKSHRDGRKATKNTYYLKNKKKCNDRSKADRRDCRRRFLEMYGGECACCGESENAFLALDHVDGGGQKHRRQRGGSYGVYKDALKSYDPDRFRTLCHNCNMATGLYGACPHNKLASLKR